MAKTSATSSLEAPALTSVQKTRSVQRACKARLQGGDLDEQPCPVLPVMGLYSDWSNCGELVPQDMSNIQCEDDRESIRKEMLRRVQPVNGV